MPWRMLKRAARAWVRADYPLPIRFVVNLVVAIPLAMLWDGVAILMRHASSRPNLSWWNPWWDFGIHLVICAGLITLTQSMPVETMLGRDGENSTEPANGESADSDGTTKPTRGTSNQNEAVAAQGKKKAG